MNHSKRYLLSLLLIITACTRQQEQTQSGDIIPKVVEAKGYIVPRDSISEPVVVPVGTTTVVKVGTPEVITINTNIHPVGKPRVVKAGTPRACIPGQNGFSLPKTVPAIVRPLATVIPEAVVAKDTYSKELNPQNFSTFGKQQGLKHGAVSCMLQDRNGNLWFGTLGGVSKFDGKMFTHYTEKEGLVNNLVWSILEDKLGNIWFGTYGGGISKYDGRSFTNYSEKEGLSSNYVWNILEDKIGNLWVATEGGGVSRLNRDGKSFTHYTQKEGLGSNTVICILEDKSGNIWFGTQGGASKYDGKSFSNFTKNEGMSDNMVYSILEDKSGNLWFGTISGSVSKYDGKNFTQFTRKEGLSGNIVQCSIEDKSGNLWFGTQGGGVYQLGRDSKNFTYFTVKEGLSNNYISSILEDRSGNLWFGTDRGVSKYDGKMFTHFTENIVLSNNAVYSIMNDKRGNLWFGFLDGGIFELSREGKSVKHYTEKEGLTNNSVFSILEDRNNNIWFGFVNGLSKYDGKNFTNFNTNNGLTNNYIMNIFEDKSGNLWFGTTTGVSRLSRDGKIITQFTVKEGLSNNYVRCTFEDKSGNMWFGTFGGGATKYDGKIFTHFTIKEGLNSNGVNCIKEDKSGNLWFGTNNGVSKLSRDGKWFTHFTEKEGLCNNYVSNILQDRSGNLWFGTRFGISKLPFYAIGGERNIFFKNYMYEDGFLGIGVSKGAMCEDRQGTIWIGANDRLSAYYPEGDMTDTVGPCIQLTNIELFNENIPWTLYEKKKDTSIVLGNGVKVGDIRFDSLSKWYFLPENLSLAYNNNFLTFNFIGITQKRPRNVKYQYKLEGFDENWSALTVRNEAPYGNLPQGTYTFKVIAMNSDGYWSKEYNYTFNIRPPWYKTAWFRSLTTLLFLVSLFLLYRWRTAALRQRQKQLEKTVKERTAEVVHQKEEIVCQNEELENTLEHLKKTQSQLIQSEKMASLGMLTAGIAHEINNPVNFINSGAISLQKDYEDLQLIIRAIDQLPPGAQKLANELDMDELLKIIPQTIEDIKTGVQRTSEIVKGLRNFTRLDSTELREADIIDGIESTLLLLNSKIKDRISVVKEYDERVRFVKCYPGPLNQVFMNLLNNAIDAIDQKIKEKPSRPGEPEAVNLFDQFQIMITTKMIDENEKKKVEIVISDNGVGIPEKIRDKLFDPFFTTKEVGKGTGLGLAICHGIIEKHDGQITFESKVDEGSVFTITIPIA
ncbi:MAG: two-component regulator propeller domain-containing protein [Bacteroidota bacterium]